MASALTFKDLPLGVWTTVRPRASEPTSRVGDYRAFPHLNGGKKEWKRLVYPNAGAVSRLLDSYKLWPDCPHCSMRGAWEDHIAGEWHYKKLWQSKKVPDEGVAIESIADGFWQHWDLPPIPGNPGGTVRFNHIDGSVQMWAGPGAVCPPAITDRVPAGATSDANGMPTGGAAADVLPAFSAALFPTASEGHWITVLDPIGRPTAKNGDWQTLPWFGSKRAFKEAMAPQVQKLCRVLDKFNVWPVCADFLCGDKCHGFEEHVPAEKHHGVLTKHLPKGWPVYEVANGYWQEWQVEGGAIRFNHLHGGVDYWFGSGLPPSGARSISAQLPPAAAAASGAGSAAASSSSAVPAAPQGPAPVASAAAPPATPAAVLTGAAAENPVLENLEATGVWYTIFERASYPSAVNGDWKTTPHLNSKMLFKDRMAPRADRFSKIVEKYGGGWPECQICGRSRGFEEHLPADKHYREVGTRFFPDRKPVEQMRNARELWQECRFAAGAVRINLGDGELQICKGEPPADGQQVATGAGDVSKPSAHAATPVVAPASAASTAAPSAPQTISSSASAAAAQPSFDDGMALATLQAQVHAQNIALNLQQALEAVEVPAQNYTCAVCQHAPFSNLVTHLHSEAHVRNLATILRFVENRANVKALSGESGPRVQKFQGKSGTAWFNHLTGEAGFSYSGAARRPPSQEPEDEPGSHAQSSSAAAADWGALLGDNRKLAGPWKTASSPPPPQQEGAWQLHGENDDQAWWENASTGDRFWVTQPHPWKKYSYPGQEFWYNQDTGKYFEVQGRLGIDRGLWQ